MVGVVCTRLLALGFLFATINYNRRISFILGRLAAYLTDVEATNSANFAVLELTR